jgi:hypothetical protein
MPRYEVIESKAWKRDDGKTASIYGAVPWVAPSEEKRWKMITRGYTVRDNERGTVGIGRQPWQTRAEAQVWVDKENRRLDELAAARGRATKTSGHATKKAPVPCIDVVFRVFPEGDVIALFPGEDVGRGLINSYQRVGQHGGADPTLIRTLRKASRPEAAALLAELKRIGYCVRVKA